MDAILDSFVEFLPGYAQDTRFNLESVMTADGSPGLTEEQILGAALASAYASRHEETVRWAELRAKDGLPPEQLRAVKIAAVLMAMNNTYYRFVDLSGDAEYQSMPSRLRMSGLAHPGTDRTSFEVFLLAVSIVNGCAHCIRVHCGKLAAGGMTKQGVQSVARIASAVQSAAQARLIADLSRF